MRVWLLIAGAGLLTFLLRWSFLALGERHALPAWLMRVLRFVPAAVLSALVAPGLLVPHGELSLLWPNEKLIAGMVALVVAARVRGVIWTLVSGFAVFWALRWWFGQG